MEWFVLWAWYAFPWTFNGIPMTPGWSSGPVFQSETECRDTLGRIGHTVPHPIMELECLPAGEYPQGQIARHVNEQ